MKAIAKMLGLVLLGMAVGACQTLMETLSTIQAPATVNGLSGPGQGVVGQPVTLGVYVYVGSNGCYSLRDVSASVDEETRQVTVRATSNVKLGGLCTEALVYTAATADFVPQSVGRYHVTVAPYRADPYWHSTPSATLDVEVLAR